MVRVTPSAIIRQPGLVPFLPSACVAYTAQRRWMVEVIQQGNRNDIQVVIPSPVFWGGSVRETRAFRVGSRLWFLSVCYDFSYPFLSVGRRESTWHPLTDANTLSVSVRSFAQHYTFLTETLCMLHRAYKVPITVRISFLPHLRLPPVYASRLR